MRKQIWSHYLFIFLILFFASSCKNDKDPNFLLQGFEEKVNDKAKAISGVPFTGEIPLSEALEMRKYYKKSKDHFKTKYLRGGKAVLDTLQGFSFDVSDLETIIKDANGKKAKDVIFYFGRDANDVVHDGKTYPRYAIIAIGVDSTGKLAAKAYDKADPCPPYCPDDN